MGDQTLGWLFNCLIYDIKKRAKNEILYPSAWSFPDSEIWQTDDKKM